MHPSDGVLLARAHAHINQGKAASLAVRLDRDDVLVPLGSNLQFHRVSAAVLSALDGLGHLILVVVIVICVASSPTAMALDGLAIFRQLFVVVSDNFIGSVIGEKLCGPHFPRKSRHRNIHVGPLLVVAVIFRSGLGAGIDRQAGVAYIGLLADVQIAQGGLDVNVRHAILAVVLVVGIDATGGKNAEGGK